jgi:hypothetical protein
MTNAAEPHDEQPEEYEPTPEEIAQMRAATPAEAQAVDSMILRECSARFQKVAMVVGQLLNEFDASFPHLPLAYVQARMQELEDGGLVEIAGDVWSMRHSEVRLVMPGE